MDVPDRSGIKWHIANYTHELRGCGAPGLGIADHNDELMVTSSKKALNKLLEILDDENDLFILNL